MNQRRNLTIYFCLALIWILIAGWQWLEHGRMRDASRAALLERAREIASTVGDVIRSQGHFGVIRQERLEEALKELAARHTSELQAVMLLSMKGQVVASAGQAKGISIEDLPRQSVRWGDNLLTMVDLVDLGPSASSESTSTTMPIVVNERDLPRPPRFQFGLGQRDDPRLPDRPPGDNMTMAPPPPPEDRMLALVRAAVADVTSTGSSRPPRMDGRQGGPPMGPGFSPQRFWRRPPNFSRPFWMDEERYQKLLQQQGVHGFMLQMSADACLESERQDLWIRVTTIFIAALAVGGLGLAWRSMDRMNRLQLRLLRASEMNAHLQELNVAAAGLAHETRNPLNIVRGLAQLIAQREDLPGEVRRRSTEITEEVDRVTGRLNEFINYSRSPQPRLAPTPLQGVITDVQRALESDLADQEIQCSVSGPDVLAEADESLLRQVVFNLILNAIQSVGTKGKIEVVVEMQGHAEISFTVRDNGPGIPAELQREVFKPYFTTRAAGTGLGLSVVRQIVLAHHWDIDYRPEIDGGAGFCVSGLKLIPRTVQSS